uniref:Uncharacterized protein n=1 Tax=Anguilla anguilla TaxID=7936 RepID=A0A0E9SPL6_ANGAN
MVDFHAAISLKKHNIICFLFVHTH